MADSTAKPFKLSF